MTTRTPLHPSDVVRWSGNQLATEIDGEVVLMNIDRGHYYSLDDVGSDIWRAVEQPIAIHELCRSLALQYNAEDETVATDVLALLNKMFEEDLIAVVPGDRP